MAIFKDGTLLIDSFSQPVQDLILSATENAMGAHASKVCTTHFLLELPRRMDEAQESAFRSGLEPGAEVRHVEEIMSTYTQPRGSGASSSVFTGALSDFSKRAQESLDFLNTIASEEVEGIASPAMLEEISALHVWVAVLSHPEAEDIDNLEEVGVFNFERAKEAFLRLLAEGVEIPVPALYSESAGEELLLEYFSEVSIEILQRSIEHAGEMGYDKLMRAHIIMALIARPDGVGERLVRRQAKPNVGPAKVVEEIERNINLGFRSKPKALELSRRYLSIPVQRAFEEAFRKAARQDNEIIDEGPLMYGLLVEEREGRVADILKLPSLEIDLRRMLRHLDHYIRESAADEESQQAVPFLLSKTIAKSEDLTYLAEIGRLSQIVDTDGLVIEQLKRGLHKRENNHILITGPSGVGKTTVVRELARQIAAGEIPFLRRKRILWVDCIEINPEESRDKLEQIIAAVKGRNDVILCLDGFEAVVRYVGQRESNNLSLLRTALQNHHVHLISVIQDRHYTELLGSEYQFLRFFTRVELTEPATETVHQIVSKMKTALEDSYRVHIEHEAIERAVILSRDFILSEQLPAKAIDTLEEACELASYEREMALQSGQPGDDEEQETPIVTTEHVIATVSERTGVPKSTLRGSGDIVDFEDLLRSSVVGQDDAVEAVARELKLIKGGAKDPSKPASIVLFAGLTGTGKTELAKTIAQVYSASKNLTVYTMGNFNESHSVSGIVGVPPGYVGYEMGGRLINDLNADSYSVVLLDEVEKAHPDIWKPFLNLFDEGWIVDQRNVKAYGNRAIFILTSNAGAGRISSMLAEDASIEEIIDAVKQELFSIVHPTARQKCFTPEFLARITQIIVFNPLSLEAMQAIAELKLRKLRGAWREKRGKDLIIHADVITHIAGLGHETNEKSNGREGGRIIPKYISSLIEAPLQDRIAEQPEAYKRANEVRVTLDPAKRTRISFEEKQPVSIEEAGQRAKEHIQAILLDEQDSYVGRPIDQVEQALKEWERDVRAWASQETQLVVQSEIEALWQMIEETWQVLQEREHTLTEQLTQRLEALIKALADAKPVKSPYSDVEIQGKPDGVTPIHDKHQGPIAIVED